MADVVNVGSAPNNGTGSDYRSAWIAINAAFNADRANLAQIGALLGSQISQSDLESAIDSLAPVFSGKLDKTGDASGTKVTLSDGTPRALVDVLSAKVNSTDLTTALASKLSSSGPADSLIWQRPGSNAANRTLVARFQEGTVSLDDFKLAIDADDTNALQRAHDFLGVAGGIIDLPLRDITVGGQVTIINPVWFRGKGWCEQIGITAGTRVLLPSTAKSPFVISGVGAKGLTFSDFAIYQTAHPAPASATTPGTITNGSTSVTSVAAAASIALNAPITGAGIQTGTVVTAVSGTTVTLSRAATASGAVTLTYYNPWTPAAYPQVFDCRNVGGRVRLDNLICVGVTQLVNSLNSGRFEATRIYGHFFNNFLTIDTAYDTCRIDHVHAWPYWSLFPNVFQYTQANMDLMKIGRCDTPFIDNIFSIYGRHTIFIDDMGNGAPTRVHIGRVQADGCYCGLAISARTNGAWIGIVKLDAMGEGPPGSATGISGSSAVANLGTNNIITIDTLNAQYHGASSVIVGGNGNSLSVGNSYLGVWGQVQTTAPAISVANATTGQPNVIRLATLPVLNGAGGNNVFVVPGANDNTIYDGFPPIAFTPTIAASSGSITSYTASGTYTRIGPKLFYALDFSITNNGTGAGQINVTLPFLNGGYFSAGFGREIATSGSSLAATLNGSSATVGVVTYSNGYPAATGSRLIISGEYYPAAA